MGEGNESLRWGRKEPSKVGQQTFHLKDQRANILGFGGHMEFSTTTQFCCCSTKAAVDNNM